MKIYMLFLMLFALALTGNDYVGKVMSLKGRAFVQKKDSGFKKLNIRDQLEAGDLIKTSYKAKVKIIFKDKSIIYVAPKSQFRIEQYKYDSEKQERSSVLNLFSGRVKLFVAKMSLKKRDFKVKTETATVGVRGTEFVVSTENIGESEILVLSGSVEVTNPLDASHKSILLEKNDIVKSIGELPITSPSKVSKKDLERLTASLNISTMMNINLKYAKLLKKIQHKKLLSKTKFNAKDFKLDKKDSENLKMKKRKRRRMRKRSFYGNGYVAPNTVKTRVKAKVGGE